MSADRVSGTFLKELFDLLAGGTSDVSGNDGFDALILGEGTSAVDDIDDAAKPHLSDFTDLNEYSHASYSRESIAGFTVTLTGTQIVIDFENPSWTTLAGAENNDQPKWVAIVMSEAGSINDTTRRLFLLLEASFTPDGDTFEYVVPSSGVALFNTDPR